MADFSLKSRDEGDIVVIETDGYLNNLGGEEVARACYERIDEGRTKFLLNLENSKVVNSIGVSILIEIIEKLQDVDGKLAYYNLAPIVEKTFSIMGLTKYSSIYASEAEAIENMLPISVILDTSHELISSLNEEPTINISNIFVT